MKTAIIISPDLAGKNIEEHLLPLIKDYKNIIIYHADKKCIYNENIDKEINADLFIFATTHRSEKGINSLSIHPPGNWNKAELGGKDKTLCIAPALYFKKMFQELSKLNTLKEFQVTTETSHHGPYLEKPVLFIEIGSGEEQWTNKEAGKIIAQTIFNTLTSKIKEYKTAILLGGMHYNQVANRILLETDYALGHICPKYALEFLDEEMLLQAINKTIPKPDLIILDYKSLGIEKKRIMELLKKLNLKYKKSSQL